MGNAVLAEALYYSFLLNATLQADGNDVPLEQQGCRTTGFRRVRRLGVRNNAIYWQRPPLPHCMRPVQYATCPNELTVREIKTDGRALVTRMLEPLKTLHLLKA